MKLGLILICCSTNLLMLNVFGVSAQDVSQTSDSHLLTVPTPGLAAEAKKAGVGGKVSVFVKVDEKGNVGSIEQVTGPDNVCPGVNTPPVAALRNAAKDAALKAKFSPAIKDGQALSSEQIIHFEFPVTLEIIPSQVAVAQVTNFNAGMPIDRAVIAGGLSIPEKPSEVKDESGVQQDPEKSNGNAGTGKDKPATVPKPTGGPAVVSGGVLNGTAMILPKPAYPAAAKAVRATGVVSIQVLIAEDGTVYSAKAVSGHPLLQASSRVAACSARFSPTLLEGKPVKVAGVIVYKYVP